jgi:putative endonuclease
VKVYILHSESLSKHYVGHAVDLDMRLRQHNSGTSGYTKTGVPWKLVWSITCSNRSEAMKLERKIKKRGAKRFLEDINYKV